MMKRNKKGVAGLNIFLTVIALLFVTGIIIMAFALASSQLLETDNVFTRTSAFTVTDEGNLMNGTLGYFDLSNSTRNGVQCSVLAINNGTVTLLSGNYSVSNCRVSNATAQFGGQTWFTNYTYTYLERNSASDVINDTNTSIAGAVDWFPIFITIAAIVVLVLLIVLIIVSLRGAGMMGTGGA